MSNTPTTDPTTNPTTTAPAPPAGSPPAQPDPATTPPADAGHPTGEDLAKVRAALDNERQQHRNAQRERDAAKAELDKMREASQTEQEKAVSAARREGEAVGLRKLVQAQLVAAAAGKLANPQLAARLLDVEQFVPRDGSEVDGAAIATALDELIKAEPYLAFQAPASPPPAPAGIPGGTVPGGARSGSPTDGTFTRAQLRDPAFYEANKDAILKAAAEGRITDN